MAMVRAIDKLGLDFDKVIHVAGIGCASVAHWYTSFTALQTAHGRARGLQTPQRYGLRIRLVSNGEPPVYSLETSYARDPGPTNWSDWEGYGTVQIGFDQAGHNNSITPY